MKDFLSWFICGVFNVALVVVLALVIYAASIADTTKESCYYKDMEACKIIYEKGGLTELSKAVAGTE